MGRSGVTSRTVRVAGASGETGRGLCVPAECSTGPWLSSIGLNCSTEIFTGLLTGLLERLTELSKGLTGLLEGWTGLSESSTGLSRCLIGEFG